MILRYNIKIKISLVVFVGVSAGFLGFFVFQPSVQQVSAGVGDNVSGWAWSETIGWISFNCTDEGTCGSVDYGVNVDAGSGDFSGYAWSETIGWIKFGPTDTPPGEAGPTPAHLAFGSGEVSGWARACTAVLDKVTCEGAADPAAAPFDGWIKLRDAGPPAYGVSWNSATKELSGWAWGSDVVGWISFNSSTGGGATHAVSVDITLNSFPTAIISSCSPADCTAWKSGSVITSLTLNNGSTDPDGNSDIIESIWGGQLVPNITCVNRCNYTILPTMSVGTWNAELIVKDSAFQFSPSTVKTIVIKQDTVASFDCSILSSPDPLDDSDWEPCTSIKPLQGDTIYFRDTSTPSEDGSFISDWDWSFSPDGNPSSSNSNPASTIFNTLGSKTVILKATDNMGRYDTEVIPINPSIPFPDWREISPF